jgi:hypothetical protein
VPEMLDRDNLAENLRTIFSNDNNEPQPILTQEVILANVNDQDLMKD